MFGAEASWGGVLVSGVLGYDFRADSHSGSESSS